MNAPAFIKRFLLLAFLLYAGLAGALYVMQRTLIYHPALDMPDLAQWGIERGSLITVETGDGLALRGAYFPPAKPGAPVIVLFHGNTGHFASRRHKADVFLAQGMGVLLAEYRGFSGNPGQPDEQALYKDARAYIDWLVAQENVEPAHIILYGESLGTGVAVQMAGEYPVQALILEAPYTSLPDVASRTYFFVPTSLLMKDQYRNIDKIKKTTAAMLIIHGDADNVVPIEFGRALFKAANPPKKFIAISKAGHNTLYDAGAALHIQEFLRSIAPSHS